MATRIALKLLETPTNRSSVERNHLRQREHGFVHRGDDTSGHILDDFRNRAVAEGEHRRSARHRFDHDQAERLGPVDREQESLRFAEEFALRTLVDLSHEFDARLVEQRRHGLPEIGFIDLVHLCGDFQGHAEGARDRYRALNSFFRRDAAEKCAPTSANKLKNEKHLAEVRRYILQRWIETGRGATLVICQKEAEQWLARSNLPSSIALAHLQRHRRARRLPRCALADPGRPYAAGTERTRDDNGRAHRPAGGRDRRGKAGAFAWYPQVKRGIRLSDGSAVTVRGDQHSDPFVEAVRWQICEAELVQAIGRGRAINRTAETPLDINLLFDTVLPITVD